MQALPMIMLGVGTGLQMLGQIQQGNAAKQVADANAQIALREAENRREAAKDQGLKLSRERTQMLGEQRAIYGASGIDISTGSPLEVMAKTASEYERDIGYTGIAADQAMARGESEAAIYRYEGRQRQIAGWLGAGSTFFSGAGQAGMYGAKKGWW